jgi:hypothetical protein
VGCLAIATLGSLICDAPLVTETRSIAARLAIANSEGDKKESFLELLLDWWRMLCNWASFHFLAAASAILLAEPVSGEKDAVFGCLDAGFLFELTISNVLLHSTCCFVVETVLRYCCACVPDYALSNL